MDTVEIHNTVILAEEMLAEFEAATTREPLPWDRLSEIAWNLCTQSQVISMLIRETAASDSDTLNRAVNCLQRFVNCTDHLPLHSAQSGPAERRIGSVAARMKHRVTVIRDHHLDGLQFQSALKSALEDFFAKQHEQKECPTHIILPAPPQIIQAKWQHLAAAIASGAQALDKLTWQDFEDLMAFLLDRFGWDVTPMGRTKDDGIDILAVRHVAPETPVSMMVQCKRFASNRPVGVHIVREVLAVRTEKRFHQAMIATTSSFTAGAEQKAQEWNLELKDHDDILTWCETHGTIT